MICSLTLGPRLQYVSTSKGKYRTKPQWVAGASLTQQEWYLATTVARWHLLASLFTARYCSGMPPDPESRSTSSRFDPPLSQIKARQMGELVRGDSRWDVLLETVQDSEVGAMRGRIHFISSNVHRLSGWIFLEWSETEVQTRFSEFSAQELWNLLNSLGGR